MRNFSHASIIRGLAFAAGLVIASSAAMAQNKEFSFAYDQPRTSAYAFGADVFAKKLSELSKGTMTTNQYPGAQLGSEAQTLQKVQTAADDMNKVQPAKAVEMERESRAKLEKLGVKIVADVDKSGFETVSKPIQDKLAGELGPNAVKILGLVRGIK